MVFDLDGTLVKLSFPALEAKKGLMKELGRAGVRLSPRFLSEPIQLMFDELDSKFDGWTKGMAYLDLKIRLEEILEKYELESAKNASLCSDCVKTLKELKRRGIRLALVTNHGLLATEFLMRKFDLFKYFDVIITRDQVKRWKPSPEGILKALRILTIDSSQALLIGDTWMDMLAAKKAGVVSVALLEGGEEMRRVVREPPDFIVGSLYEILRMISLRM